MTVTAKTDERVALPVAKRRRRRRSVRLTRRDKVIAALLIGIPLLLALAFVWFPALASVFLSFTKWTGIGSGSLHACTKPAPPGLPAKDGCLYGVQNYHTAFTRYPDFWPAVRHNVTWLVVFIVIATPLGMLFAVLLDCCIRGPRGDPSLLLLPMMLSLALIGIIWELIYSNSY